MSKYLKDEGVDPEAVRAQHKQVDDMYKDIATEIGFAVGGAIPGAGIAVDAASAVRSAWQGDWFGAAVDVFGMIPGWGDAAKAAEVTDKVNTIRRTIDVARTGLKASYRQTKQAAAKYWDDVVKKQKAAYEAAAKKCNGTKECLEQLEKMKYPPHYDQVPTNGTWTSGSKGDGWFQPADASKPPIKYTNGFPDLSPHSKGNVDIPMKGNHSSDFTNADKAMREQLGDDNWTRPEGYTWHHHENGTTMQLVPQDIHSTSKGGYATHTGGAALYKGSHQSEF